MAENKDKLDKIVNMIKKEECCDEWIKLKIGKNRKVIKVVREKEME
ncbi:MAG: hypothetical protein HUJ87_14215 [Fusobacterium varium]|jgi:hypothetical protein|nr:hypothetical protein [Fusobacterium varium]MCF0171645.1 hypothetical protein [Fusobacterium varium]MCI6032315.1 hypothetical protein [Fusobacterium varium]DAK06671.1 MAG TPA: hypothetical protein [Caudoviricetes sp.]